MTQDVNNFLLEWIGPKVEECEREPRKLWRAIWYSRWGPSPCRTHATACETSWSYIPDGSAAAGEGSSTWATIRTCRNWSDGFGFGRTKPRPPEPKVTGSNPVGPHRDAVPCEPIGAVVPCPRRDAANSEPRGGDRRHLPDRGQAAGVGRRAQRFYGSSANISPSRLFRRAATPLVFESTPARTRSVATRSWVVPRR